MTWKLGNQLGTLRSCWNLDPKIGWLLESVCPKLGDLGDPEIKWNQAILRLAVAFSCSLNLNYTVITTLNLDVLWFTFPVVEFHHVSREDHSGITPSHSWLPWLFFVMVARLSKDPQSYTDSNSYCSIDSLCLVQPCHGVPDVDAAATCCRSPWCEIQSYLGMVFLFGLKTGVHPYPISSLDFDFILRYPKIPPKFWSNPIRYPPEQGQNKTVLVDSAQTSHHQLKPPSSLSHSMKILVKNRIILRNTSTSWLRTFQLNDDHPRQSLSKKINPFHDDHPHALVQGLARTLW